jgi:hypothetical protein
MIELIPSMHGRMKGNVFTKYKSSKLKIMHLYQENTAPIMELLIHQIIFIFAIKHLLTDQMQNIFSSERARHLDGAIIWEVFPALSI